MVLAPLNCTSTVRNAASRCFCCLACLFASVLQDARLCVFLGARGPRSSRAMCSSCARHVAANHDKLLREREPRSLVRGGSEPHGVDPALTPSTRRLHEPYPQEKQTKTGPRAAYARAGLEPERVRDVDGPRAVPEVQGRRPRGARRLPPVHFHGLEVAVSHETGVVDVSRPRLRAGGAAGRPLRPLRAEGCAAALGAGQRSSVERREP